MVSLKERSLSLGGNYKMHLPVCLPQLVEMPMWPCIYIIPKCRPNSNSIFHPSPRILNKWKTSATVELIGRSYPLKTRSRKGEIEATGGGCVRGPDDKNSTISSISQKTHSARAQFKIWEQWNFIAQMTFTAAVKKMG